MVSDEDRLFHRAGRDLVRLDHERSDEEDEYSGNEKGLVPLAGGGVFDGPARRFLFAFGDGAVHSTFKTARNASCGMSTRPTLFIRFLPSFCFSRSFLLRVMSPP